MLSDVAVHHPSSGIRHVDEQLDGRGQAPLLIGVAIARALWAFFRTYVLRAGFLDGREGFMLALATAEGTYYRYAKLMRLPRK